MHGHGRDEKLQINFAWFYLLILHKRLQCSRSPTSYALIAIGPILMHDDGSCLRLLPACCKMAKLESKAATVQK